MSPIPITPELIVVVIDQILKLKLAFGGNSAEEEKYMRLIRDLTQIGAEHIPEVIDALNAGKSADEVRELMKTMRKPVEPKTEEPDDEADDDGLDE
jgi:hypothetical protein